MLVKAPALCFPSRILWHRRLCPSEPFSPSSQAAPLGSVGTPWVSGCECKNMRVHRVLLCFCLAAKKSVAVK